MVFSSRPDRSRGQGITSDRVEKVARDWDTRASSGSNAPRTDTACNGWGLPLGGRAGSSPSGRGVFTQIKNLKGELRPKGGGAENGRREGGKNCFCQVDTKNVQWVGTQGGGNLFKKRATCASSTYKGEIFERITKRTGGKRENDQGLRVTLIIPLCECSRKRKGG